MFALVFGVGSEPEQLAGSMVTGNYFDVLGAPVAAGRTLIAVASVALTSIARRRSAVQLSCIEISFETPGSSIVTP
jgi:hypothetical protein